jgi:SulP family sulfate permease
VGKILHLRSQSGDEGRTRTYFVAGQVFFASADRFANAFDYKEVLDRVRIDVSRAHFWDITAISALDKVVMKFRREGTEVDVLGLNAASATLVDKFAVHDKDSADDVLLGH